MGPTVLDRSITVSTVGWWTLYRHAASVQRARELTAQAAKEKRWNALDTQSCVQIATELVTNSIQHAHKSLSLMLRVAERENQPYLDVIDWDPTPPLFKNLDAYDLLNGDKDPLVQTTHFGMGLKLVDGLSVQWGWHALPYGKCVWSIPLVT